MSENWNFIHEQDVIERPIRSVGDLQVASGRADVPGLEHIIGAGAVEDCSICTRRTGEIASVYEVDPGSAHEAIIAPSTA
jgi:hypothetical protein